jgi:hypothetical protein
VITHPFTHSRHSGLKQLQHKLAIPEDRHGAHSYLQLRHGLTLFTADDGFVAALFAAEDEFATALFAAAFPLFAVEDDLAMALAGFLISAAAAAAMEGDEMRKAGEDEANRSYIYGGAT